MSSNQKIGVTVLLGITFILVTIAVILSSSSTFSPLTLSYTKSSAIYKIIPQGFAFFTRDPREPAPMFYKITEGGNYLVNHSSAAPDNLFGLSRKSRRENREIAYVLNKVKDELWTACPHGEICQPDSAISLINDFPNAHLKGNFLVKMETPVPWAWSKSKQKIKMKHKIVEIELR